MRLEMDYISIALQKNIIIFVSVQLSVLYIIHYRLLIYYFSRDFTMRTVFAVFLTIALVATATQAKKIKSNKYFHPLSDEFINHINSMKSTWKVLLDFKD